MAAIPRNPADLLLDPEAALVDVLSRGFTDLHDRQRGSEASLAEMRANQSDTIDSLVAQITNTFSPMLSQATALINAIKAGEFIRGASETAATFAAGVEQTLLLDAPAVFPFLPAGVVMLRRSSTVEDYAFARVVSWQASTRALTVVPIAVVGDAGPHDDVVVEIAALSTLLIHMLSEDVILKHAAVLDKHGEVMPAAAQVADDRAVAEDAAEAAAASAAAAQTWNPANYLTAVQVNSAIAGAIAALVDSAPGALNTLNELAAALGDDANFGASVLAALADRYTKAESNDARNARPPVGAIVSYKGLMPTLAGKWLAVDRSVLSRASYADLFAKLGHRFFLPWSTKTTVPGVPAHSPQAYGVLNGRIYVALSGGTTPGLYEIANDLLSATARLTSVGDAGYNTSRKPMMGYNPANGKYCVLRNSSTNGQQVYASADGNTWAVASGIASSAAPVALTVGSGVFALLVSGATADRVYSKADPTTGAAWTTNIIDAGIGANDILWDAALNLWVVAANDGKIYTSPSLAGAWTKRLDTGNANHDFDRLFRAGGYVYAMTASAGQDMYRSADGITWALWAKPFVGLHNIWSDGTRLYANNGVAGMWATDDDWATSYELPIALWPMAGPNGGLNWPVRDAAGRIWISSPSEANSPPFALVPVYSYATQFALPPPDIVRTDNGVTLTTLNQMIRAL